MKGVEFWTNKALIGVVETLEVMLGVRERMVEVELVPTVKVGLTVRMVATVPEGTATTEVMEVVPLAKTVKIVPPVEELI